MQHMNATITTNDTRIVGPNHNTSKAECRNVGAVGLNQSTRVGHRPRGTLLRCAPHPPPPPPVPAVGVGTMCVGLFSAPGADLRSVRPVPCVVQACLAKCSSTAPTRLPATNGPRHTPLLT